MNMKINCFSASVLSMLLYASIIRNRYSPPEQNQCFPETMPMIILNIRKEDHVTNEHVH